MLPAMACYYLRLQYPNKAAMDILNFPK